MSNRREVLRIVAAGATVLAAGRAVPAFALEESAAREFVRQTIDEVLKLVRAPGAASSKADQFRAILERRAAMPQIARAAAGQVWRDLSASEQEAYSDAFAHYVSKIYASRFSEYTGQEVSLGQSRDLGKRGILVESTVTGGDGAPAKVEWLVSDRPGKTVVADIVIEGVSMVVTQRDEISGIYQRQGRDAQAMIDYLRNV